jgi:ribonuclease HI
MTMQASRSRREAPKWRSAALPSPPLSAQTYPCQTCGAPFQVQAAALARYPGWKPRFCREHSPKKKAGVQSRGPRQARGPVEENLTLAAVLAKYSSGPASGVFTDGSSVPNPGPGGWGFVWVEAGEVRAQGHGHVPQTTNNRMELQALIEAFRALPADAQVVLHSDSRLCVDTIETWAPGWERKGWTRKGGPIMNLELVQELLTLRRAHPGCRLQWIPAHSGMLWNEYADSLSTAWQRQEL